MTANLRWLSRSPNLLTHAVKIIRDVLKFIVEGFFGFSPTSALVRQIFRSLLFLAVLLFFATAEFMRNATAMQHYRSFVLAWQAGLPGGLLNPELINFGWAIITILTSLSVLRELLVIFVPYLLALEFAAIYQHDVFERNVEVTRTFIHQAVFAAHYHVIHVRNGAVVPEDEDSPILPIGGPGLVEVELDSAIVLEDADHAARVIGPTGKYPGGMAVLSDFERIRQSFDLRERSVSIASVKARSRDGIEVEARDLHYVFSINRGDTPSTKENPYPFHIDSLINLVYNSAPPKGPGWKTPIATDMNMPINLALIDFISRRSIGEFLASIGQPELEAYEQRKQARDEATRKLAGEAQPSEAETIPKTGTFAPRTAISEIFNSDTFRQNVKGKGFTLRWVGVGTWHTGAKVIPELHLEAWQVSRNNVARSSESVLKKIQANARYDHLLFLLSQVVITPYFEHIEDKDSTALINHWLNSYDERLQRLKETYDREKQAAPDPLKKALDILKDVRQYHTVGSEEEDNE